MMDVTAGIFDILGSAFALGRKLITLYQALSDAQSDVSEQMVYMRNAMLRNQAQREVLKRVWSSLGEAHQELQRDSLKILLTKMAVVNDKLEGLLKKRSKIGQIGAIKRWRYMLVKPVLDDSMRSMDRWQRMYDPSWYLIMRMADPTIDQALNEVNTKSGGKNSVVVNNALRLRRSLRGESSDGDHVSLSSKGLTDTQTVSIPYCSARYMPREGKDGLIVVSVRCLRASNTDDMERDVRTLVQKLHCAESMTFSILRCRGYTRSRDTQTGKVRSFEMVFETATTDMPRTLRSCLVEPTQSSMTQRLSLAKQLAKSVSYVHTLDFVHKNIRPENLIGFGEGDLGDFFLIGFEQVRRAEGMTYFQGDTDWHKNIYRHPERQGSVLDKKYCMQHDIYSLGVCLLEIGLWQSFVLGGQAGQSRSPNTKLLPASAQQDMEAMTPDVIKDALVGLANRMLPTIVGELYTEVVVNCLTCLDGEDNIDFGDAKDFANDQEGMAIGVRYIEKVLLKLESINL